jgi:uncharacterized protein YjiS (DUF1127 family)
MVALDMTTPICVENKRYDFFGALLAGWHAFRQRRRERRTLVAVSRLDPHMIRDMGFDPDQVYAALDGSWDEIDPASFGGLLPRRARTR